MKHIWNHQPENNDQFNNVVKQQGQRPSIQLGKKWNSLYCNSILQIPYSNSILPCWSSLSDCLCKKYGWLDAKGNYGKLWKALEFFPKRIWMKKHGERISCWAVESKYLAPAVTLMTWLNKSALPVLKEKNQRLIPINVESSRCWSCSSSLVITNSGQQRCQSAQRRYWNHMLWNCNPTFPGSWWRVDPGKELKL